MTKEGSFRRRGRVWTALTASALCLIAVFGWIDVFSTWVEISTHTGGVHTAVLSISWVLISWVVLAYALFYFSLGIHRSIESRRIHRYKPESVGRAMARLSSISRSYQIIAVGRHNLLVVGFLALLGLGLSRDPHWFSWLALSAAVWFWLGVRLSTPPAVLFLSTSDERGIGWHHALKQWIAPCRVIALLSMQGQLSQAAQKELELDCLRAENDDNWWPAFQILVELAPVVIVDGRVATPGLMREGGYLADKFSYKCGFINSEKGDCRLLEGLQSQGLPIQALISMSFEQALRKLSRVMDSGELPSADRPFGSAGVPAA